MRTAARIAGLALVAALAVGVALAGTQNLTSVTDNSTNANVPVTNHLMVTITTSASQGGNDATDTLVSVGGTVAAADVGAVHVYYAGLLVASATNPASLTNISIPLAGNQKGGSDWTYYLDLNASAAGKTFNLTVTSITGTSNTGLPFTTATRTASSANQPPTATITNPTNGAAIGGPGGYAISGTANDPDGSVTSVAVRLQRLDNNQYWNGTGWTATETWNPASGTTSWSYAWNWTLDMDAVSVVITARATDNQGATGTDTRSATVDSKAPVNTVAVHLTPDNTPLSGEALTLSSSWTENSPGANVPQFQWTLNGSTSSWSNADSYTGGVATRASGVTLNGDDVVTLVASRFTDSFGNGPTLSQDATTIWVQPLTPQTPIAANNGTTDSLDFTLQPNPSETGTVWYAIRCFDAAGSPTGWVQSNPGGCGGSEVWHTAAVWGSPVVVTGLAASTTYRFATAAGNPNDPSPTTGENSASPYSAQANATTSAAPRNDVVPGSASATIDACTQITVSAPYTGDDDGDSTTVFERSDSAGGPWTTVPGCGAVTGASPRQCVDANVAEASVNYYRVSFTDPDNSPQPTPEIIGPYDTTPYCVTEGTTIASTSAEASSCKQITVTARFTGDGDDDGSVKVETAPAGSETWTTACDAASGPSPRQCIVPSLTAATAYDVRVTYSDPDGVAPDGDASPNAETVVPPESPVTTPACAGDGSPPTVLPLSPQRNAVLGGTDWFRVQVHDPDGLAATDPVLWSVDGGPWTPATVNSLPGYACGDSCFVYEVQVDTTSAGLSLANGPHEITFQVTDGATPASVARVSQAFQVNNKAGGKPAGDGLLLRRTRGSQMCRDCHNIQSHSSQTTSKKYGSWAIECGTCHTPHDTTNVYLLRPSIRTPNSGDRPVRFESLAGAAPDSSTPGSASYVNEDNATQADGPCQVCHTRTQSAGGDPRWRNAAAGGNADTHYISASTGRCTGCHTHDAGFSGAGGACDSCHNAPPPNTDDGPHESHYVPSLGLPASYSGLTPATTATEYGFACAKCHSGSHLSDNSAGTLADPYDVQVVFDATTPPANGAGSYTPGAVSPDQGPNGKYWGWSEGTCSNLYCHSNAAPVGTGATLSQPSITWSTAVTVSCTSCHSTSGRTDSGLTADLSTAHGKHIQSTSGETGTYSFRCNVCHAATIVATPNVPWNLGDADLADKREHVDGEKDVVITSAYDGDADGANNYAASACSDTYCHSQGTTASGPYPPPNDTTLTWDTDTATCRSCHGGDAASAPVIGVDSGSATHAKHVANAAVIGTNYECAACHSATVSAGNNGAITNYVNHVNKVKTVAGTRVDATYTSPTCTASYCHSSGQAPAVSNFEYYTANWTSPTPLDCKGCHGRHSSNAFTSIAGEPNYANGGAGNERANSHSRHVSSAAACTNCHNDTTATGTAILSASTLHTDQVREVRIAATWDANGGTKADNYTEATKTCASISCHGGLGSSAQWGASLTCLACHSGTEGDPLGNGVPNGVNAEWTTDGHGAAAGGSLNSALNGCDYCHQLNAAHTPTAATNPYRLRFATTDNTLCLQCHGGGPDGTLDAGISQNSDGTALTPKDSTLDVDTAHYGAKHAGTEGGKLCWDCHDPHGVPTNILMVKTMVSITSNAYGVPTKTPADITPVPGPGVSFTARAAAGDFVRMTGSTGGTPRSGVCQACHDPTKAGNPGTDPTASTKYWRWDETDNPEGTGATLSSHNSTKPCTDCHFHNADFKGAGDDCLGCHQNDSQSGTYTRRAVGTDFANTTGGGQPRSHHAGNSGTSMGGTLTNFDCVVCHMEGYVDTTANPDEVKTSDLYHGGNGGTATRTIDLRDADTNAIWVYDKNSAAGIQADPSIAGVADWNSGSQYWREWTSGVNETGGTDFSSAAHGTPGLDPFCLSCHDYDGAKHLTTAPNDGGGTAMNPFADTRITNEYDQVTRVGNSGAGSTPNPNGRVVDVASRVASAWRIGPPSVDPTQDGYTAADRDQTGESRYTESPTGGDGRADPPLGVYSRHAIRGQSVSVYGSATGPNGDIVAAYWNQAQYPWEDNSVMGCADCHTTDGSGGSQGNAHGADSEYMLKNIDGVGIEGTLSGVVPYDGGSGSATAGSYNCYLCHARSGTAPGTNHTGNDQDYQDYTQFTGSSRVPASTTGGNIYALACGNCHGGAVGGTAAAPTSPPEFGTIHGTTQVFGVGQNGASSTRQAYRFMNGNSMRYYQPPDANGAAPWDWTGTSATCYTIASGDSFGGCTKHGGKSGGGLSKATNRNRDLKY